MEIDLTTSYVGILSLIVFILECDLDTSYDFYKTRLFINFTKT